MNLFYVYEYIDPRDNKPFYIGKGINNRINQHLCPHNLKMKHPLYDRINEIFSENLEPILKKVEENLSETEAFNLERHIIKEIGLENLTNKTGGGAGAPGVIPSEATRSLMSESAKGRKCSEETRRKMSEIMKGKKHTEKTRRKMSKSQTERFKNPENHPLFGKEVSEETRRKQSEVKKGKKFSRETRQKMSIAAKRRWSRK